MPNMQNEKTPMPLQEGLVRITNFDEVALGYTEEQMMNEAERCLHCVNHPCTAGCPVSVMIPDFIKALKTGNIDEAYGVITKTNSFPSICGRVCPQENQCEKNCVRAIRGEAVAIGRLERYVADHHTPSVPEKPQANGMKVAVVGSGPAGLACAADLAKEGFAVTIYEALHEAGGVLRYGIPEFRLPKRIVDEQLDQLKQLGVTIETNVIVGKTLTMQELEEDGFQAVFIGSGAGLPKFMGIPGETAAGVFSANEVLTRVNLMKAYREDHLTPYYQSNHTIVVGGGNVAMDAARCARRLGKKVTVVYRRSLAEIPARKEEVEHAMDEDITFMTLHNPVEIYKDEKGFVKGVKLEKMELGEPDERGRRSPVPTGEMMDLVCDCVIMALGTSSNPLLVRSEPRLQTNPRGCLIVDEQQETTMKNVYAGGDAVSGAATVILALGAGKRAAASIIKALTPNKA
ncbi:NADPH-dependent glutamate synthase [Holdemania massiliensis]